MGPRGQHLSLREHKKLKDSQKNPSYSPKIYQTLKICATEKLYAYLDPGSVWLDLDLDPETVHAILSTFWVQIFGVDQEIWTQNPDF